jgi:murein DD-endopeptidase MepM/ murein hydrolase activator NlpD
MLLSPFRAVWRLIVRWFPERDFLIMDTPTGRHYAFHQTSFWRAAKGFGKLGLVVWAVWATYVFVYTQPMVAEKTNELNELRIQHARQLSDLVVYQQEFNDLTKQLNLMGEQLNNKKLKDKEIKNLQSRRAGILGQLDFLQGKLKLLYTEENYSPDFFKVSELSLEYEITRAENERLRSENTAMTEAMLHINDADYQIVERVSALSSANADALSKNLKRISGTLASLGLSEKTLVAKAMQISNPIVGSAIAPMNIDGNLDEKYQKLANAVELWQGLDRISKIIPMGAPVDKIQITSQYGTRTDPFTKQPTQHNGIDFAGTIGTPLMAVAPGKVVFAGDRFGYGKVVEIDHGLGFTTLYAHLSRINVKRGETVRAHDIVGLGGSTGRSTGPHLHYEIRYNDNPFNPYNFVKDK